MLGTNFLVKIKESNNSLDRTVELFPYQISANECFEYCQKFLIKNLDLSEFTSSPKKAFDWGTVSIVSETDSEVINSKIDHILIEYKNI